MSILSRFQFNAIVRGVIAAAGLVTAKTLGLLGGNVDHGTDPGHSYIYNNIFFDGRGWGTPGSATGTNPGTAILHVSGTSGTVSVFAESAYFIAADVGRVITLDGGKYITLTAYYGSEVLTGTVSGGTLSKQTFAPAEWICGSRLDANGWPKDACQEVVSATNSSAPAGTPGQVAPGTYHGWYKSSAANTMSLPGTSTSDITLTINATGVGPSNDCTTFTMVVINAITFSVNFSAGIQYAECLRDGTVPTPGVPTTNVYAPDMLAYYSKLPAMRLMGYLDTNVTAPYIVSFGDRPLNFTGTFANILKPYSYETGIAFANAVCNYPGSLMRCILWNTPPFADASHATGVSALFTSLLDSKITATYIERGNEHWQNTSYTYAINNANAIVEAQTYLNNYAYTVPQIVSVLSDGAGTATVTLTGSCADYFNSSSASFITNGASAYIANGSDSGFNAGSAGSPITITVPSPSGKTFTYPLSGSAATQVRYMQAPSSMVATFTGGSALPIPRAQQILSVVSDGSGVVTVTTGLGLSSCRADGFGGSGAAMVQVGGQMLTYSLSDSSWHTGMPARQGLAVSPVTVLSVGANSFTYQGTTHGTPTFPISTGFIQFIFNPLSNLINDGVNNPIMGTIGQKLYVRGLYQYRQAWIANRPFATYGDKFGLGIQISQFARVYPFNNRVNVNWDYATFLGGGISAVPFNLTAAKTWLQAAYGAPYCVAATSDGTNSGTPWSTVAQMAAALKNDMLTNQYLSCSGFVYTCKRYGLEPVAYEGTLDVQFNPALQLEFGTDNTGVVQDAMKTSLDVWFQAGGSRFFYLSASPGAYYDTTWTHASQTSQAGWPSRQTYTDTTSPKGMAVDNYATPYAMVGANVIPGSLDLTNISEYNPRPLNLSGATFYWGANTYDRWCGWVGLVNGPVTLTFTLQGTDSVAGTVVDIYVDDVLSHSSTLAANGSAIGGAAAVAALDSFAVAFTSIGAHTVVAKLPAGRGGSPGLKGFVVV